LFLQTKFSMTSGDAKSAVQGSVSVPSVNVRKCEVYYPNQIFISVFNPLSFLKRKPLSKWGHHAVCVCPPLANVDLQDWFSGKSAQTWEPILKFLIINNGNVADKWICEVRSRLLWAEVRGNPNECHHLICVKDKN